MTTFVYTADGRIEQIITEREPEWDEKQVAWLVASRLLEADIGQYGESLEEAYSPMSDPANRDATVRYKARGPRVNHAEQVVESAKELFYKDRKDAPTHGHHWFVEKLTDG